MFNISKKLKLVTHNGSFHADDVFACAVLSLMLEQENKSFEIIRTRDEKIIKTGDYVFDVGGVYDAEKDRFDHHQKGGAGQRKNGIEYSSVGLVWRKFGVKLCDNEKIASIVDQKLIAPIDAGDNGIDLFEKKMDVMPYLLQQIFFAIQPTWREETDEDKAFLQSVDIAKVILSREIIQAQDAVLAEETITSIYENTENKKIIVFDRHYPFEYILPNFPEPFFAIYQRKTDNSWGIRTVAKIYGSFDNRKDFPKNWGGLRDEELQKITGIPDAIFCHRGLFLMVAKSKEGAIKLAQIALES